MTADGDNTVYGRPGGTSATDVPAVAARPSATGGTSAADVPAVAARPSVTGGTSAADVPAVAARRASVDSGSAEVRQMPPRSRRPWNRVRGK